MAPTSHPHHTSPPPAPSRVALYVHGDQLSSVERQEQLLRSYLRQHHPDWPLVAIYQDTAPLRCKPPLRRPGMRNALQAASSGAFDVLLTERLSHIGRHIEHVTDVAERLHAASVAILTADGTVSTADPLGRLIMGVLLAVVSHEREQREAEQAAKRSRADTEPSRPGRRAPGGRMDEPHRH